MKIKKYYIAKKTTYHLNGERAFELGQKYEFIKRAFDMVFLKLKYEEKPLSKEFFKNNFKQKAIK